MSERLAVVGDPIRQSLSPALHRAAIRAHGLSGWTYVALLIPRGGLRRAWPALASEFLGLNVTAPHKEAAAALVDELEGPAIASGSVNCITFGGGRSTGTSTDGEGFLAALAEASARFPDRALVLGAGGAARAVGLALRQRGAEVVLAARDHSRAETVAAQVGATACGLSAEVLRGVLGGCQLVVNATPVGSDGLSCPLPPGLRLRPQAVVFDLLYAPSSTPLQRLAADQGCRAVGGLGMLVEQAALSFERWTGLPAPRRVMREAGMAALAAGVG